MSEVIPGKGITLMKQSTWVNGHEVQTAEISVGYIDPSQIDPVNANPGDVLTYGSDGRITWEKPFDSDAELRSEYPALEEAWGVLMESTEAYQMVKKLVQCHD